MRIPKDTSRNSVNNHQLHWVLSFFFNLLLNSGTAKRSPRFLLITNLSFEIKWRHIQNNWVAAFLCKRTQGEKKKYYLQTIQFTRSRKNNFFFSFVLQYLVFCSYFLPVKVLGLSDCWLAWSWWEGWLKHTPYSSHSRSHLDWGTQSWGGDSKLPGPANSSWNILIPVIQVMLLPSQYTLSFVVMYTVEVKPDWSN